MRSDIGLLSNEERAEIINALAVVKALTEGASLLATSVSTITTIEANADYVVIPMDFDQVNITSSGRFFPHLVFPAGFDGQRLELRFFCPHITTFGFPQNVHPGTTGQSLGEFTSSTGRDIMSFVYVEMARFWVATSIVTGLDLLLLNPAVTFAMTYLYAYVPANGPPYPHINPFIAGVPVARPIFYCFDNETNLPPAGASYDVDWGDGSEVETIAALDGQITFTGNHIYASAGTFTITANLYLADSTTQQVTGDILVTAT